MFTSGDIEAESNPAFAASAMQWACDGYERAEKRRFGAVYGLHPLYAMAIHSVACSEYALDEIRPRARNLANYASTFQDWVDDPASLATTWKHSFWQGIRLGVSLDIVDIRKGRIFRGAAKIDADTDYGLSVREKCVAMGRLFGGELDDRQRWMALQGW